MNHDENINKPGSLDDLDTLPQPQPPEGAVWGEPDEDPERASDYFAAAVDNAFMDAVRGVPIRLSLLDDSLDDRDVLATAMGEAQERAMCSETWWRSDPFCHWPKTERDYRRVMRQAVQRLDRLITNVVAKDRSAHKSARLDRGTDQHAPRRWED